MALSLSLAFWVGLAISTIFFEAAASAASPVSGTPQVTATGSKQANATALKVVNYRNNILRTVLSGAGAAIFCWGFLGAHAPSQRKRRVRKMALLLLALASYASYYQFFSLTHRQGFATPDNFHYYVGSKYADEVGYFGLYECSLYAINERNLKLPALATLKARDLESMEIVNAQAVLDSGADCPGRFGTARWLNFGDDVQYFYQRWSPPLRQRIWLDHGYHPTPIWSLIGQQFSRLLPLSSEVSEWFLIRLDRFLIGITLLGLVWAFGLETACLVTIFWGTGMLWKYTWVGDAFLRHLWWAATMIGLMGLRRGHAIVGGAALTTSALLRLFPILFSFSYLIREARNALATGRIERPLAQFAAGAAVTTLCLVVLSLWISDRGAATYVEFLDKILHFNRIDATNQIGLQALTRWLLPGSHSMAAIVRILSLLGIGLLLWKALPQTNAWEAAAAGGVLIPFLTDPTNYYYSFFAAFLLFLGTRPWICAVVLLTGVAWNLNGLIFYQQYDEYFWASVIAVVSSVTVAWALNKPPGPAIDNP